jgi:hypothetical protein
MGFHEGSIYLRRRSDRRCVGYRRGNGCRRGRGKRRNHDRDRRGCGVAGRNHGRDRWNHHRCRRVRGLAWWNHGCERWNHHRCRRVHGVAWRNHGRDRRNHDRDWRVRGVRWRDHDRERWNHDRCRRVHGSDGRNPRCNRWVGDREHRRSPRRLLVGLDSRKKRRRLLLLHGFPYRWIAVRGRLHADLAGGCRLQAPQAPVVFPRGSRGITGRAAPLPPSRRSACRTRRVGSPSPVQFGRCSGPSPSPVCLGFPP